MNYYLYRHIRLDKYGPFYIGVGSKTKSDIKNNYYSRSIEKRRNNLWKKIANKTEYKVEILLESDNYQYILNKEKEFIKMYGRKDLKNGSLTNLTDGGEFNKNRICSEELKKKRSINAKKRWDLLNDYEKLKILKPKDSSKKVIDINNNTIYKSIREAYKSKNFLFTERHFRSILNNKYSNKTNFKLLENV